MCVPHFTAIHPIIVQDILLDTNVNLMVALGGR